jgi:hypothetical protein
MEEIANHTLIESGFPGVILGAIHSDQGLLLVDSPFRTDDQHTWRSILAGMGVGKDRLLVMLDTHIDRTLGLRALETDVIGHENSVAILQDRPTAARSQDIDAGADWEPFDLPANIRWVMPDITYSNTLNIYWDDITFVLEHHDGSHSAGTWLKVEEDSVVFIGDSVVTHQPPFLAYADLTAWIADLDLLLSDEFKGYKVVSSRNGIIRSRSVEKMRDFLVKTQSIVTGFSVSRESMEDLLAEVPGLLKTLSFNKSLTQLYHNRLAWGLEQYYKRHYFHSEEEQKGEH